MPKLQPETAGGEYSEPAESGRARLERWWGEVLSGVRVSGNLVSVVAEPDSMTISRSNVGLTGVASGGVSEKTDNVTPEMSSRSNVGVTA